MEEVKQLSLRWDAHAINLASEAECFYQDEAFLDCTLFAEGQSLQAHKLILSAASPYLATILRVANDKHPVVVFNDIKFEHLRCIVNFIYNGCISIPETQMPEFMHAAQTLLIRGLTQSDAGKSWCAESNNDSSKKPVCITKRKVPPNNAPPVVTSEEPSPRLQEMAMSNFPVQSARRYCKPMAENPNFVMSSWKLGAEEKNGTMTSRGHYHSDDPPAHMFKKFRLEKPPPDPEPVKPPPPPAIKQEENDEIEEEEESADVSGLVVPKVEVTEDEPDTNSEHSTDAFYNHDDDSPVPLLVCRTSLQEEGGSGGGSSWGERPQDLPCARCNKRYKSRYALNRHVLYECGKARKSFSCDECGKKVTRQDTLQKHKLIHLVQHMKDSQPSS